MIYLSMSGIGSNRLKLPRIISDLISPTKPSACIQTERSACSGNRAGNELPRISGIGPYSLE